MSIFARITYSNDVANMKAWAINRTEISINDPWVMLQSSSPTPYFCLVEYSLSHRPDLAKLNSLGPERLSGSNEPTI